MNIKLTTFFSLLACIILIVICSESGQAQIIAIKAGKVVDPATGVTSIDQIILIEGGKIRAIGANLTIPEGVSVIDLSKQTVIVASQDGRTSIIFWDDKRKMITQFRHAEYLFFGIKF